MTELLLFDFLYLVQPGYMSAAFELGGKKDLQDGRYASLTALRRDMVVWSATS